MGERKEEQMVEMMAVLMAVLMVSKSADSLVARWVAKLEATRALMTADWTAEVRVAMMEEWMAALLAGKKVELMVAGKDLPRVERMELMKVELKDLPKVGKMVAKLVVTMVAKMVL